jgi:hypothetical protein
LEEKTGASFASVIRGHLADGSEVPVAHACGHDLHMTAWVGTAVRMAAIVRVVKVIGGPVHGEFQGDRPAMALSAQARRESDRAGRVSRTPEWRRLESGGRGRLGGDSWGWTFS